MSFGFNLAKSAIYPGLAEKIASYKVTRDSDMPPPYRQGTGRERHSDWLLFKSTPRIDTAYKCPLPFRMIRGNAKLVRVPIPLDYPLVPGTPIDIENWYDGKNNVPKKWILTAEPIQPAGKWGEFAVYLPNGKYEPCFKTRSVWTPTGKVPLYLGLRHDVHPIDACCWMWELSASLKWWKWD